MYIIENNNVTEKYFSGWNESGRPMFCRNIIYSKRFFERVEAERHKKWIPYMTDKKKKKINNLKIISI